MTFGKWVMRGILTTTVLAIVALDDGLALLLYGFASSVADLYSGNTGFSLLNALGREIIRRNREET